MAPIQEIKEKLDIGEIIGERIKLQRRGKNLTAPCPFHSEKTPSFFVSPELQRFICFGCKRKGDVFTFIQEYDRLTFRETLEYLAERAGIELKQEGIDPKEAQRQEIFEILELTQKYYQFLLLEHEIGTKAREYLKERGLQSSTIKTFGIGYSPSSWDSLSRYLIQKKKFSADSVIAAGLALAGKKGLPYDRFRDRIMFPLHDHRGRTVGFSGRLLDTQAKEAKYINTPETAIYHKRYLLYGYWQNLEGIREKESVIVTEGEFDVLSSVQAHVRNIVAVKGSALTEEQVRTLARTVQTIYLALDADSAGVEATKRAIQIVQDFPVALRVIPLKGGKDPDDLARQDPAAWREMVKDHISAFEYVLDHTLKEHGKDSAEGLKRVTNTMLELISTVEHVVERSFYLKQLAGSLGLTESLLEEQWQQFRRHKEASQLNSHRKKVEQPENEGTSQIESDDSMSRYFLQLLIRYPKKLAQIDREVNDKWFAEPAQRRIIHEYREWMKTHDRFEVGEFSHHVPEELQDVLSTLYVEEAPVEDAGLEKELLLTLTQLEQRWKKLRLTELASELEVLEAKDELNEAEEKKYQTLQKELAAVTRN